MSAAWRDVRPTSSFWEDLERQLPDGDGAAPTRIDFQTYELLHIFRRFAQDWEQLPKVIPGRSDYRVLITAGVLVAAISVIGQLAPDAGIELVELRIDVTGLDDLDEDVDD